MLDSKESNRRSDNNEAAVKEQFENLGYIVDKLDRKASKGRRPDFLISDRSGQRRLLCEVKTVDSAFYPRDKKKYGVEHVHISTLDPKLIGAFGNIPIDLTKIDKPLAEAVRQRAALVAARPETADLPLLVALFLDQFVKEYVFAYPRSFEPEVSGILTIARDVARNAAFQELSRDEQERRLRAEALRLDCGHTPSPASMDDLPPHSTDFVLVPNQAALRAVPEDFERRCLPDAYYG